jgi:hypothetical protein
VSRKPAGGLKNLDAWRREDRGGEGERRDPPKPEAQSLKPKA